MSFEHSCNNCRFGPPESDKLRCIDCLSGDQDGWEALDPDIDTLLSRVRKYRKEAKRWKRKYLKLKAEMLLMKAAARSKEGVLDDKKSD